MHHKDDAGRATELLVVRRVDALGVDELSGVFEDAGSGRLPLVRELLRHPSVRRGFHASHDNPHWA